jgi:hypothetical protein
LADWDFNAWQDQAPDINFASGEETKMFYETMYNEIKFVMTSVHDVSLKDAWSRVLQSVLEPLPNLETLLINFSVVRIAFSGDGRGLILRLRQWRIRSSSICVPALFWHRIIGIATMLR